MTEQVYSTLLLLLHSAIWLLFDIHILGRAIIFQKKLNSEVFHFWQYGRLDILMDLPAKNNQKWWIKHLKRKKNSFKMFDEVLMYYLNKKYLEVTNLMRAETQKIKKKPCQCKFQRGHLQNCDTGLWFSWLNRTQWESNNGRSPLI